MNYYSLFLMMMTLPLLASFFCRHATSALANRLTAPTAFSSLQYRRRSATLRKCSSSLHVKVATDVDDSSKVYDDNDESNDEARQQLQKYFSFPLDSWQVAAGASLLSEHNVIVCAPTGAGKTVVGEIALHIAMERQTKAIYTTPLKALSNQKFGEMRQIFSVDKVGLSTGDISIRRGADITIMTTEVYRNMAWRAKTGAVSLSNSGGVEQDGIQIIDNQLLESASARLDDYADLSSNSIVVLDEFHYMGQKGRGSTWEESVIFTPPHTQIVGLSATLPNAHRLAAWMESVTGRKSVLVEAGGKRPVPLKYYFASKRDFAPLFRDEEAGPGANHGLLGLRGDGITKTPKKLKGMKEKSKITIDDNALPRGLDLHPTLQSSMERRLASIDRRIQKIVDRESYDDYGGGSYISGREKRRMKENMLKAELRKQVPSISTLIRRLQDNKLLPAIFFIFSRKGCDNAAQVLCENLKQSADEPKTKVPNIKKKRKGKMIGRDKGRGRGRRTSTNNDWDLNEDELAMIQDEDGRNFRAELLDQLLSDDFDSSNADQYKPTGVYDDSFLSDENIQYYSDIGLLKFDDCKNVAYRLLTFNMENEEIAFSNENVEQILCGIGSHHAGMLPAHKAFVETLFRLELMKVVFATETLAAGINMPARTTVICSMAKRGDKGMDLLETSNMLQMAGRAGRRGMDTEGACVVAATAFEGPEDAIQILTNEIKPVVSQFTPSFALAVNLVERGAGKLDLARSMVQKSFAVWESRQREEEMELAMNVMENYNTVLPEEQLLNVLQLTLEKELIEARAGTSATGTSKGKISKLQALVDILSDGKKLKKVSKRHSGYAQMLELEQSTLKYLERELRDRPDEDDLGLPADMINDEKRELLSEIKTQRQRVLKGERDVNESMISIIAKVTNNRMKADDDTAESLKKALEAARQNNNGEGSFILQEGGILEPGELNFYVKNSNKKNRSPMLALTTSAPSDDGEDENWSQVLALLKVLESYGCLAKEAESGDNTDSSLENSTYSVSSGGTHVGSLGMDNSLWTITALGGAFDVAYDSAELDKFQDSLSFLGLDDDDGDIGQDELEENSDDYSNIPKPQKESEKLVRDLCNLSASEMAGFVSALVVDAPRQSDSAIASFQKLTYSQQRVVQGALLSMERLTEVQRLYSLDDSIGKCQLELSSCDVVTAWASGESWNDVLLMSGAAPGDLVRTLSRCLDALKQIGNLPYVPARAEWGDGITIRTEASGIHPKIRTLCREAANEMDRYPVKDIMPFEIDNEGEDGSSEEDEEKENDISGDDEVA
jgi:superfamily II RNA helicase